MQAVADVLEICNPNTFVRPIYAGNALATVQALGQGPRLLTVRPTAFAAAPASGGSAAVEAVSAEELAAAQQAAGGSEWVGEDVRKSGGCVLPLGCCRGCGAWFKDLGVAWGWGMRACDRRH